MLLVSSIEQPRETNRMRYDIVPNLLLQWPLTVLLENTALLLSGQGQTSGLVIMLHSVGHAEGFVQTTEISLSSRPYLTWSPSCISGVLQAVEGGVLSEVLCLTQSNTQYRQIRTRCCHS